MDESLKTGRNIHRVLVGVCAAIILFGLSPSRTGQYESAVRELESLKSLDERSLLSEVHETVNSGFGKFRPWTALSSSVKKNRAVKISDKFNYSPVAVFPFIFQGMPIKASLSEIEEYFATEHPVYVFMPYKKDWETGLVTNVRLMYSVNRLFYNVEAVDMKDPDALEEFNERMQTSPGNISTWPDSFLRLRLTYSHNLGLDVMQQKVRGRFIALRPDVFENWFRSREKAGELLREIDGDRVFLPEVRPFWNDIRTLSIDSAIVTLNRKKAESRNTMSVLGLMVDDNLVVIVAPLITLCIICYMLVHILHIHSIADRHPGLLSEFPWMALFSEWPARELTLFSMLLFPLIANGTVIIRASDSPARLILSALALVLSGAAVGVFTIRKLDALRREYCANAAPPSP